MYRSNNNQQSSFAERKQYVIGPPELVIYIFMVYLVYSPSTQIGRRLAEIGDQINDQYEGEFRSMITSLHITPSTAYSAFAGVARR